MIKHTLTLIFLILFFGCSADNTQRKKDVEKMQTQENNATSNETAPSTNTSLFQLETIKGETIHVDETNGGLIFHEFKDQIVMFIFFGYRCPPCLAEIPVLSALNNQKKSDLTIIGLEVQGLNQDKLKAFAERTGANYHLIVGQNHRDFVNYILQKANWQGSIPFLLTFDKKGVAQVVHVGGLGKEQFDKIYAQLSQQ